MHQATDDRGRQLGPSHATEVAKCCHVDRAKLRDGDVNPCGESVQSHRDFRSGKFQTFRLNRRELFRRQRVPSGVGEEAIDDSGNVSHMKGGGGYTGRASVPFLLRQRLDDLPDTLANLKKNVRDWLKDIGDAVDGTALPPLSIRHVSSTSLWRAATHANRRVLRPDVGAKRVTRQARAWCPAVGAPIERGIRPHLAVRRAWRFGPLVRPRMRVCVGRGLGATGVSCQCPYDARTSRRSAAPARCRPPRMFRRG